MKAPKFTAGVVLYTLIATTLIAPGRLLAECPLEPENQTTTIETGNQGNCGSPEWELKATVPGNDQDDEGPYLGQGLCYGGFTLCNCSTAAEGYTDATLNFHYDSQNNDDGSWTMTFWWDATNWLSGTYVSCGGSGSCASTGHALELPNATYDDNIDTDWEDEDCDD